MPILRSKHTSVRGAKLFAGRADFVKSCLRGKKLTLLDVGNLGDGGPHANYIRALIEEQGGTYVGLDVNANLAKELGYERQVTGDLHNLQGVVDDASFDCVYAGEIIEHSWHPGDMVRECARILKPGGFLLLDTPNVYDVAEVARVYLAGRNTLGDVPELTYEEVKDNFLDARKEKGVLYTQPQHKIFYGPAALRQLLNMHGFSLVEIAYIDKSRGPLQRLFVRLFPQAAQKVGALAQKKSVEEIYTTKQFGDA